MQVMIVVLPIRMLVYVPLIETPVKDNNLLFINYSNLTYRLETEAKGSTRYRNPRKPYRTRARSARVLWRREGFYTA